MKLKPLVSEGIKNEGILTLELSLKSLDHPPKLHLKILKKHVDMTDELLYLRNQFIEKVTED